MIIHSYDDQTQALMGLEDFYGEQRHLIDLCLITYSHEIYSAIVKEFPCEEIGRIRAANGSYPIYKFPYQGMEIGFYLSGIGSTLAAQFAIEANWLTGASKFIMFGSAGSLDKEKTRGKYVIPTESYRDEGMSYHYAPARDYIAIKNHAVLRDIFQELGVPFVEGRVWTTDAFLRETTGQVEKRRQEGCIAVEMELAGVQAVCDFHGLQLYDFLVTGDVLSTTEYDTGTLSQANHDMDKFYLALQIAQRIARM